MTGADDDLVPLGQHRRHRVEIDAAFVRQRRDVDLGAAPGPSGLNNNIESVWNRSGRNWYFYPDRNYNGSDGISGIVPRGVKDTLTTTHRNKTSSLKPL